MKPPRQLITIRLDLDQIQMIDHLVEHPELLAARQLPFQPPIRPTRSQVIREALDRGFDALTYREPVRA